MDSIETQILFGPHLLLLLSLPSPPSSRLRIWISGSQMLQCPLTPRLSRPCSLSHDFSFFPISDRPLRFHELPVIPSSFFFIFSVLHTPHTDFSRHSAQISDANLLSQVTQHITLLHSPASLCFPACVRVFVWTCLTRYFFSAFVRLQQALCCCRCCVDAAEVALGLSRVWSLRAICFHCTVLCLCLLVCLKMGIVALIEISGGSVYRAVLFIHCLNWKE